MDMVFIKNLRVTCILGVYEWERETPREVVINVELSTDTKPASRSDNLADCLDYENISQQISRLAKNARRFTVEALAEDIANFCLRASQVQEVMVRVEKPGAIPGADSAGVEIVRKR